MGDRRRETRYGSRGARRRMCSATAFTLADRAIVRGEKNHIRAGAAQPRVAARRRSGRKVNPVEREAYMAKLADGFSSRSLPLSAQDHGARTIVSVRIDVRFRVEL